jgi:hypothetical protein
MLLCTDEMYPVTFDHWVTTSYHENCHVHGKYILVHTFTNKFCNVHTQYIPARKSCTRTYRVHTISLFCTDIYEYVLGMYWYKLI